MVYELLHRTFQNSIVEILSRPLIDFLTHLAVSLGDKFVAKKYYVIILCL
jgi:hypothetical protein